MSKQNEAKQARENLNAILSRSTTDPEFRQKLLTNPREAMSEAMGTDVPDSFNIRFVENEADATFVLPDPVNTEAALSEEELEAVAGGESMAVFATVMGTLAIAESIKRIGDDDAWTE